MPHLDDTQVRQKASYIVSTAQIPAPAGNEKRSLKDAIKGEHPIKGLLLWMAIYGIGASIIAFTGLVNSVSSTPSYPDYTGTGMPETASTSGEGSPITTYALALVALILVGIAVRTNVFTKVQRKAEDTKFSVIFDVMGTIAKWRFYLAGLVWFLIAFDWGTVSALVAFAVVVFAFYTFDRRSVDKKAAETKTAVTGLNIANADCVVFVQGVPTIYTHHGTYSQEEVRAQKMPNSWMFIPCDDGIRVDAYKPKPAPRSCSRR